MQSPIGPQSLRVNGHVYAIDSLGAEVATHYPAFDTLQFLGDVGGENGIVLCNFKPDSSYSLIVACCGSLDIVPSCRLRSDSLKVWDAEENLGEIQALLMDRPFISIRTRTKPRVPIYAWHADAACETALGQIGTRPWPMGVPTKCFYWNNITTILLFTTDDSLPPHAESDLEEFLGIPNIVELGSLTFRLFDNQRFMVVYDARKHEVSLRYE